MLASISPSFIAAAGLASFLIYRYIIYPVLLSPLSKIPNAHFTSPLSPVWILSKRYKSVELASIHDAHRRIGPVVRLGPNEVSVNCVKGGIHTVYTGGFEKGHWYDVFANGGRVNMFSMAESKQHSLRKRMLSNIYAKSSMQNSEVLEEITEDVICRRLLPRLQRVNASSGDVTNSNVDIVPVMYSTTFDYVAAYIWGLHNTDSMLNDEALFEEFFGHYEAKGSHARYWWLQELPTISSFVMGRLRIVPFPKTMTASGVWIERFIVNLCDKAARSLQHGDSSVGEQANVASAPVYSQISSMIRKAKNREKADVESSGVGRPASDDERLDIASELQDHMLAGFETSGITLTYLVWELSRHPKWQASLHKELREIYDGLPTGSLPSAKALDSLPVLQAVLQETLRLHAAIPGPQPRITPNSGCTLGPDGEYPNIPGGVRISAQGWSLHRNDAIFPDAQSWQPDRWLKSSPEDRKEMDKWFWAFGSGGRMCIGSNFAIYQMKYVAAALYSRYATEIVDDTGIEQMDMYTAPPQGGKLVIRLSEVQDGLPSPI